MKNIKRGELLIKPGDRPKNVYLVTSGRISVLQPKGDKNVELFHVSDQQVLGEELISTPNQWGGGFAVALSDAKIIEVPAASIRELIETLRPEAKAIFKGVMERAKSTTSELKKIRVEKEQTPCPGDDTARVFGVILHSAKAVGREEDGAFVADWEEFKNFAVDIFGEPQPRLEEACAILLKLGYLERAPGATEFEGVIQFKDLVPVENFFEFYYSYHFKPNAKDMLRTNERASRITDEFLKIAESTPADRGGRVTLPYKPTIDAMKKAFDGKFEADQLFALQTKGLMVKHTADSNGGTLMFIKQDFLQMLNNWRFLKEIELWNERGFVDPTTTEVILAAKKAADDEAVAAAAARATAPAAKEKSRSSDPAAVDAALKQVLSPARQIKPPANGEVRFRKGDTLFKAGEPADRVYLIQTGLVSLMARRGEVSVEVAQATAPQLIGEEALWGAPSWSISAVAVNDTQVVELGGAEANAMIESIPGSLKHLLKSVLKKQKVATAEVLTHALEKASSEACPNDKIPALFAVIYHAAVSTGKPKGERLTVVWSAYRKYCHWGLRESPVRLEQTMELLAKLGLADLEMVASETDPDAPPELGFVHFKDIGQLQHFYRYYQENKSLGIQGAIDALSGSFEAQNDPVTQKHLLILKEIQAWNKAGKVIGAPGIPQDGAGEKKSGDRKKAA